LDVRRFSAFSDGNVGGNPAGVVLADEMPEVVQMQRIAADVGYSETAFAVPFGDRWRVRYFSPEFEVPFCGHATIALGAALAIQHGDNVYALELNDAAITVEGRRHGDSIFAALQSPATTSQAASQEIIGEALALFGYSHSDLDPRITPALAEAGAKHLILGLSERSSLANMAYELTAGRDFMTGAGLITVNLVYAETSQLIHSRNPFASGGVYEDPATGAAAAALAGYLRDLNWPHGGRLSIVQGEDMGMRSLLTADFSNDPGSSVRVSGTVRLM
jgi:PhzF family phenazine biosynthesis protein